MTVVVLVTVVVEVTVVVSVTVVVDVTVVVPDETPLIVMDEGVLPPAHTWASVIATFDDSIPKARSTSPGFRTAPLGTGMLKVTAAQLVIDQDGAALRELGVRVEIVVPPWESTPPRR